MDLQAMFGQRYEVTPEESWGAESPETRAYFEANGEKWWYYELRGRRGMIFPYSATELGVDVPPRHARRLVQLIGLDHLTLLQNADDLVCYKTGIQHAGALVRFIKPKSRRQLTEAHKAQLAARLAAHRHKRWKKSSQTSKFALTGPPQIGPVR